MSTSRRRVSGLRQADLEAGCSFAAVGQDFWNLDVACCYSETVHGVRYPQQGVRSFSTNLLHFLLTRAIPPAEQVVRRLPRILRPRRHPLLLGAVGLQVS